MTFICTAAVIRCLTSIHSEKKKNFYSLFFSHHVHVNSSLTWRSFSLYLFVRFAHATDSACLILNKRCKLFVSPLIYTRVVTALNLPTTHHLIHTGGRKRWCIDAIALRRLELQSSMLSPLVWIQRPIDLFVVTTKTTTFFVARAHVPLKNHKQNRSNVSGYLGCYSIQISRVYLPQNLKSRWTRNWMRTLE